MLSNSEVAVFCEQSGMILESGLSMLEGISIMEEDCFLYGLSNPVLHIKKCMRI